MDLPEGSEYVALGSSYAAGPGLGDRVANSPRRAGRSTRNYAHDLADRLKLRLTDATYSGATIAQILGREAGATPISQLESVTAETRFVTVTGGGNDLGYIGYLVTASLPALVRTVTGGNFVRAVQAFAARIQDHRAAIGMVRWPDQPSHRTRPGKVGRGKGKLSTVVLRTICRY